MWWWESDGVFIPSIKIRQNSKFKLNQYFQVTNFHDSDRLQFGWQAEPTDDPNHSEVDICYDSDVLSGGATVELGSYIVCQDQTTGNIFANGANTGCKVGVIKNNNDNDNFEAGMYGIHTITWRLCTTANSAENHIPMPTGPAF